MESVNRKGRKEKTFWGPRLWGVESHVTKEEETNNKHKKEKMKDTRERGERTFLLFAESILNEFTAKREESAT